MYAEVRSNSRREVPSHNAQICVHSTPVPARMRKHPQQERSTHMVKSIREAAVMVFRRHETGSRVSMQEVALKAGASLGSVYQYYANMESVIASIYEDVLAQVVEQHTRHRSSLDLLKNDCLSRLARLDEFFEFDFSTRFYGELVSSANSYNAIRRCLNEQLQSFSAGTDYGF